MSSKNKNAIKNNKFVQEWANKNQLNFNDLSSSSWSELNLYAKDRIACENCPGLSSCPKRFKGKKIILEKNENDISSFYTFCKYSLVNLEKRELDKGYLYRDFADEYLNHNKNDLYEDPLREKVMKYVEQLLLGKKKHGLYIHGEINTGKTFLMRVIANFFAAQKGSVMFLFAANLANNLRYNYSKHHQYDVFLRKITTASFLFIDDLGSESWTPWFLDDLANIFDNRWQAKRLTFVTSNFSPKDLQKKYQNFAGTTPYNAIKVTRLMHRIENLMVNLNMKVFSGK